MRKKNLVGLAAALTAALVVGPALTAHAGTVYTGARSCAPYYTARTTGIVQPNNTIKHYQSINGIWWASPTYFHEGPGSLSTNWWYAYGNRSFANSYITSNNSTPSGTSTSCFN